MTKKELKKINAPFGYFGSKNSIALHLCSNLPPHNCWVEAFCGSASLTLKKKPAPIEVINDIDNEIVNFFEQLRNNHERLCDVIELTPYAEKELLTARQQTKDLSDLERARRFLVQSMMAINGIFGTAKGGFSYSDSYSRNDHDARVNRWNNLPERLKLVVSRLKKIRIENKDALHLLGRYVNRPATLVYLDPPYLGERTNGYNNDANDEGFHRRLLELSNKANCMIFISGYENNLYNSILTSEDGWEKKSIETSTKDSKGKSHSRTEVVWMNKHYLKALKTQQIPVNFTEKEKKEGKVNPERK
jgi:DNA adenine methylase